MLAFNTWSFQKEKALGQLVPIWRENKSNRGKNLPKEILTYWLSWVPKVWQKIAY